MSVDRKKAIAASALIIGGLAAVLGAAAFGAWILFQSRTGADPAAALHEIPPIPAAVKARLEWLPEGELQGRAVEPATRVAVSDAYLRAWAQYTDSFVRGAPTGLETYFNGPALAGIHAALEVEPSATAVIFDLKHRIHLDFYSADGQVMSFTDDATIIRSFRQGDLFDATIESDETFRVVMILQDGNWRIRQFIRENVEVKVAEDRSALPVDGMVGVNYYPQSTPWLAFWTDTDPEQIRADLAMVDELGFDTIRTFVPYPAERFGFTNETLAEALVEFLDLAEEADLQVMVTLFDLWSDWSVENWPFFDEYARVIAREANDHPALYAYDIKNEIDLDFGTNGPGLVEKFIEHQVTIISDVDPDVPLTVGWAKAVNANRVANRLDFVSFHFYRPVIELEAQVTELREQIGDKEILVTEFGLPTWNSIFPHGNTEEEQARYVADMLLEMERLDVAGFIVWTLFDFSVGPPQATTAWRVGPEVNLGLVRADGTLKPAARLFQPEADLFAVPRPTITDRLLKPFWLIVMAFGLVALTLVVFAWRWQARKRWPKRGTRRRRRRRAKTGGT